MSFSVKVKNDICRVATLKDCCNKAEFIAFFLINGNIRLAGMHRLSVFMQTEHSASVRKMFILAKEFSLEREISVFRRTKLNKNQVFTLNVPPQDNLTELLKRLDMLDENGSWRMGFPNHIREDILADECCRRAYLRGAFLACGSISEPEGSYHLEFSSVEQKQAELLVELLEGFNIHAGISKRKESSVVYIKGAEDISQLLILMGSHRSLLEFESVRVEKEVRNQVNRQRNCDTANINRVVSAGMRQVEDINFIIAEIGWDSLPQTLKDVAEMRLEYPDYSLTDLSDVSSIGRSAVNHRLRRLKEIAQNIRDFGPEHWNERH